MYIRIVRGQSQPGKLDEMAQKWKEGVEAHYQGVPGFRTAYFSGDRAANQSVAIVVLDSKPDEAALARLMQQVGAHLADLAAGPPSVEDYEVLTQV